MIVFTAEDSVRDLHKAASMGSLSDDLQLRPSSPPPPSASSLTRRLGSGVLTHRKAIRDAENVPLVLRSEDTASDEDQAHPLLGSWSLPRIPSEVYALLGSIDLGRDLLSLVQAIGKLTSQGLEAAPSVAPSSSPLSEPSPGPQGLACICPPEESSSWDWDPDADEEEEGPPGSGRGLGGAAAPVGATGCLKCRQHLARRLGLALRNAHASILEVDDALPLEHNPASSSAISCCRAWLKDLQSFIMALQKDVDAISSSSSLPTSPPSPPIHEAAALLRAKKKKPSSSAAAVAGSSALTLKQQEADRLMRGDAAWQALLRAAAVQVNQAMSGHRSPETPIEEEEGREVGDSMAQSDEAWARANAKLEQERGLDAMDVDGMVAPVVPMVVQYIQPAVAGGDVLVGNLPHPKDWLLEGIMAVVAVGASSLPSSSHAVVTRTCVLARSQPRLSYKRHWSGRVLV